MSSETPVLYVRLTSLFAKSPVRSSPEAAGLDLYAAGEFEKYDIPPRSQLLIPLDIQMALHPGTFGMIASRSGVAVKQCLHVGAGIIDADYRGNIQVLLVNHSDVLQTVYRGTRIAQLLILPLGVNGKNPTLVQTEDFLSATERGEGGFGSTGV